MTQLVDDLKAHLLENTEREFLKDISLDRQFTGQDMEDDTAILQEALRRNGLGKDDVVFMVLGNSVAYISMNQVMWRYGITAYPVASTTSTAELVADYGENQYSAMVFNQEKAVAFKENVELRYEVLHLKTFPDLALLGRKNNDNTYKEMAPTEDTLGWTLNTSGMTRKPKQVGLSYRFMRLVGEDDLMSHHMTKDDTVLIVMPMFHVNVQELVVVSILLSNGRIVIAPKFSASHFWQWINAHHCTWSSAVPTIVAILLKNQQSLDSFDSNHQLRLICCASAMLPINHNREFSETFGVPTLESYSMTESCSQCTLNLVDTIKVGSVGKPYGNEVKVVDSDDLIMKTGIEGEIAIRGPYVITNYSSLSPKSLRDGWLLIGDLGYYDKDGYLWLNGRSKNVISRGDEKINPIVIENATGNLDFVRGTAAVSLPDDIYGEIVAAAIILQPDAVVSAKLKEEVRGYCAKYLVKHECPTEIYFVEAFPLNPTNKIMRSQLPQMLAKQQKTETV